MFLSADRKLVDATKYYAVLTEIDAGPVDVSKWEADFIESLFSKPQATLTEKQCDVIDEMARKYLHTGFRI